MPCDDACLRATISWSKSDITPWSFLATCQLTPLRFFSRSLTLRVGDVRAARAIFTSKGGDVRAAPTIFSPLLVGLCWQHVQSSPLRVGMWGKHEPSSPLRVGDVRAARAIFTSPSEGCEGSTCHLHPPSEGCEGDTSHLHLSECDEQQFLPTVRSL